MVDVETSYTELWHSIDVTYNLLRLMYSQISQTAEISVYNTVSTSRPQQRIQKCMPCIFMCLDIYSTPQYLR